MKINWGEKGVKGIRYIGEMPRDFRGCYTGMLYAFNERRPLLGIDVRDLPGLADKEYGGGDIENFEARQDDGSFKSLAEIRQAEAPVKATPASKRKSKPGPGNGAGEPQEETVEVTNDE